MTPDRPSTTATLVAFNRAAAHGRTLIRGFSDPIAEKLLPRPYALFLGEARRRSGRIHAPRTLTDRVSSSLVAHLSDSIPLRTVAIDAALREAAAPQLVVLGAGLDGRAWRMEELAGATVFEVDHPATQRYKRERVASLKPCAGDVRFVSVDFEKESLVEKLEQAGHRSDKPTFWLWEGVVMYLQMEAIRGTLRGIAARSAPGSRVAATYVRPDRRWRELPVILQLVREPLRTVLTPAEIASEFRAAGWDLLADTGVTDWSARFGGTPPGRLSKRWLSPERLIVTQWPAAPVAT